MLVLNNFADVRYNESIIAAGVIVIIIFSFIKSIDHKNYELSVREREINIFFGGLITFVFIFLLYTHFDIYLSNGWVRAIHPRYYFIVLIPFYYLLVDHLKDLKETKLSVVYEYLPSALFVFLFSIEFSVMLSIVRNW